MNAARIVESSTTVGTPALTAIWLGPPNVRPPVVSAEQRPDQPVLGPRRELELELDLARDALDQPQQLVRASQPEVVAALALGERHRVDQSDAGRSRW